jgi:hypothetical protein
MSNNVPIRSKKQYDFELLSSHLHFPIISTPPSPAPQAHTPPKTPYSDSSNGDSIRQTYPPLHLLETDIRPNIQPHLLPTARRQPRMQHIHPPLPLTIKINPEKRTPLYTQRRQQFLGAIEICAPRAVIHSAHCSIEERKLGATITTCGFEDREKR